MGPLLRRKLQDASAKAKQLNDPVTNLPLRQHGPEQPLHQSGQGDTQHNAEVYPRDRLEGHRFLGVQSNGAHGGEQRNLHGIGDSRNSLREVAEEEKGDEKQQVENEVAGKGWRQKQHHARRKEVRRKLHKQRNGTRGGLPGLRDKAGKELWKPKLRARSWSRLEDSASFG